MAHIIALPKQPSAIVTAQIILENIFRIHGFPKDIVSEQGPQFISRFWKEFCRLICAKATLTSGYHPEAKGQTERLNQQMKACLQWVVSQNSTSWSTQRIWVECAYNSLPTSATGFSPFKCVSSYRPPVFADSEPKFSVPHTLGRCCRYIWISARQVIIRKRDRVKRAAHCLHRPAPEYQPGH